MCCAHIYYEFRSGDKQDFYACASREGIEWTEGRIYDDAGFSGSWYCDEAFSLTRGILLISVGTLLATM
jgi:hypothetical protein